MDRINAAGHVGRRFVAEDLPTNRPPTEIDANWLNGVQEELLAIIEDAGIAPDSGVQIQVLCALRKMGVWGWKATAPYSINARVVNPVDGNLYRALTANTNKPPELNASDWARWGFSMAEIAAQLAALNFVKSDANNNFSKAQRSAEVALPATTGTATLDLSLGNNFSGTLTGNLTLANPTNIGLGQSGVIRIINGATPYSLAFGSVWKFSGGVVPTLTATAGAVDLLPYYVESATRIWVGQQGDSK